MSGSPYDQDDEAGGAPQQLDIPPPPEPGAEAPAAEPVPSQLGFPQRPPPPPQFIGYGVDGQPLYGYKPGISPIAKLAIAALAAGAAAYAIGASSGKSRRRQDD